ncbi:hypothetical protein KKF63_07340, partial [bacterium]|nr:hypothetical protein [bacterium]
LAGDEKTTDYQELATHTYHYYRQNPQKPIESLFFDLFSSKHLKNRRCKGCARTVYTKPSLFQVVSLVSLVFAGIIRCTLIQWAEKVAY